MLQGRGHRFRMKLAMKDLPPRDLLKMIDIIRYRVNAFSKFVEAMETIVPKDNTEFREQFDDIVPWTLSGVLGHLKRVADKLKEDIEDSLDYFRDFPQPGLKALFSSFERAKEFHFKDIDYAAERVAEGVVGLRQSLENYKGTDYYPKYVFYAASKMYSLATRLPAAIQSLKSIETYHKSLLALESKERGREYGKEDSLRLDNEPVETLYHASTNAKQLMSSGFSATMPATGGIGGSQSDNNDGKAISFTGDLYHAKEIMRALKEAVMLSQGVYSTDMLLRHIKNDPDADDILKSFRMTFGVSLPRTKEETFDLYQTYLTLSKKRYNPVFWGHASDFVKNFEKADYSNVGIVAATVDMTNPAIKYLDAMAEYRVPPEAVIKIEKLIQ